MPGKLIIERLQLSWRPTPDSEMQRRRRRSSERLAFRRRRRQGDQESYQCHPQPWEDLLVPSPFPASQQETRNMYHERADGSPLVQKSIFCPKLQPSNGRRSPSIYLRPYRNMFAVRGANFRCSRNEFPVQPEREKLEIFALRLPTARISWLAEVGRPDEPS